MENKTVSKIAELLNRPQPKVDNIRVNSNGVVVVIKGKLNTEKLIKKTLSL